METASFHDAAAFERFGQRFLGFAWNGVEAFGYILIDRAGQGWEIDTGAGPVFSSDGGLLATLQRSDANYGGFEGFAIWQVYGNRLEPLLVTSGPPLHPMFDWRVDRWEGNSCLHISAVSYDRYIGDRESPSNRPRDRYIARSSNDWQITEGDNCHGVVEF